MRFPPTLGLSAFGSRLSALVLCLLVAGCGVTLPDIVITPPAQPVVEPAPAPQEPPAPRAWLVSVSTVPGARVWAYEQDPARPSADAVATEGAVTLQLVEAGYSLCAEREGYYTDCTGVHLTEDTHVALELEVVPPPPVVSPEPPVVVPPVVDACAYSDRPTASRMGCLQQVSQRSPHWQACTQGSGLACHLFVRDVARALAAGDLRWGLLSKNRGEQQCSTNWCGGGDGSGYGEDVITYRLGDTPTRPIVIVDIIQAAGIPGAGLNWLVQDGRREGNDWAPVP